MLRRVALFFVFALSLVGCASPQKKAADVSALESKPLVDEIVAADAGFE